MRRWIPILAGLVFCIAPVYAQSGLSFLALDPDPVAQGTAGAYAASTNGAFAAFLNPAGVAVGAHNNLRLGFQQWIADARTYSVGGRFSLNERTGAGLYIFSTTSGDLESRDGPGPPSGTFEVQYLAVGAAVARRFGPVQLGLAGKVLSERVFEESATGFAFDGGIQAELTDGVKIGMAVQHLGSMNELSVESTPLPRTLRGGVSIRPFQLVATTDNSTLLSTELRAEVLSRSEQEEPTSIRIGAEATLFDLLTVRGGYISGDPIRTVSAGAGLSISDFNVDYALVPLDTGFGTGQMISLGYSW